MVPRRLIDIGVNLTDKMFNGIYRGAQLHKNDFTQVLMRAKSGHVNKMIITGGSLSESKEALELSRSDSGLFCTVGCHPTKCLEFAADADTYYSQLKSLILSSDKVVAVGECGLDYDREHFCPRDVQLNFFELQLKLAEEVHLPLFLHCRSAHNDLLDILKKTNLKYSQSNPIKGVVHTFDGSAESAGEFLRMGLYIGINGCSMKTENNLEVIKSLPLNRILLETDAPWCEIRPTHASYKYVKTHPTYRKHNRWEPTAMVKGRNEPANLVQVLEVVAALHCVTEDELAERVFQNTIELFSLKH